MNGLWQILFRNNANPPFVANDIVKVFYDSVTNTFTVTKNGAPLTSGPTLGDPSFIRYWRNSPPETVINYSVSPINDDGEVDLDRPDVQFCDGTTLVTFEFNRAYPYATRINNENHSSCAVGTVCDIAFTGPPELVRPTAGGGNDGSITVTATSSYGPVRYAIENLTYAQMTNTTGVFSNLPAGNYDVFAKDTHGCVVMVSTQLVSLNNYSVRWRLQYNDKNGSSTKVDILQLDYSGSITEVCGTDTPFVLRKRGENKNLFDPIFSTECSVNLVSETNYQFLDLFTQNDREFLVRYYKDDVLKWSGFITPGLYTEQYWTDRNYYISANATDQLTLLNDIDFADNNDDLFTGKLKIIKIIAMVLSKTDLLLPIHVACDIYENDFSTLLSPFDQTYVDVETTFVNNGSPVKCIEVLSEILKPFGARIYQWDNAWKIESVYQKNNDSVTYRVFDKDGVYQSDLVFAPIVLLKTGSESNRAAWIDYSTNLEVVAAAGTISVNYDLKLKEWGFKNGGFEKYSLQTGYPGWSLFLNGNTANLERSSSSEGNNSPYKLKFVSQSNNSTYGEDAYILSENVPIIFSQSDAIKFSFDFKSEESTIQKTNLKAKYLKFKWSLTVAGYYLQDDGTWSTDSDLQWVEVIIPESKFNDWQTIEIHTLCPPVTEQTTGTYNVRIMHGSALGTCWKFITTTAVKALPTVKLPAGYIILYVEETDATTTTYRWYTLTVSTAAENIPDAIRPNDYDATTNKVVWINTENAVSSTGNRNYTPRPVFVNSFDNVNLQFLPMLQVPPEEKVYTAYNDNRYKNNIETTVTMGDAPVDIINSKNIYDNYFRRSNGDTTYGWIRTGFTEFQPLLSLLAKQYLEQYRKPRFLITGTFICDHFIGFDVCLKDGSRYLIPMGMEIDDKRMQYTVELHETERADSDTVNPFGPAEFNTAEFGADYDI